MPRVVSSNRQKAISPTVNLRSAGSFSIAVYINKKIGKSGGKKMKYNVQS